MSQQRSKTDAFGAGMAAALHGRQVVLNGKDFKAAERLTSKDRQTVFAMPGETCERVPSVSWPWLIAQGLMRPRACTCPLGHPRIADTACPVTHDAFEKVEG